MLLGLLPLAGCVPTANVARTPSDISIRCSLLEPDRDSSTEVVLAEKRILFPLESQQLSEFKKEISLTAKNIDANITFLAAAGDISTGLGVGITITDSTTGNSYESWGSTREVGNSVSGELVLKRPYFLSQRATLVGGTKQARKEFAIDCTMEPDPARL
jgi:hypothetical protein